MTTPTTTHAPASRALFVYAFIMVLAVLFLILAGAMVTSTDSGLAVPDWPLSFGQVMPEMTGGVFYEHGHRMVATAVGALTVILALWIQLRDPRRWLRRLAWATVALVVVQGLFGGVTVLLKLPVWTSTVHACLAQSFLLLTVWIAMALAPGWPQAGPLPTRAAGLRGWTAAATAAIFLQLVLGAVMRHMNAGLAIPDWPTSFGQAFPPSFTSEIAIHFAHRWWAAGVVALVAAASVHTLRTAGPRGDLRRPAVAMMLLVLVQAALGVMVVLTQRHPHTTSTHVVLGAILLAVSFVLTLRAWRGTRRAEAGASSAHTAPLRGVTA